MHKRRPTEIEIIFMDGKIQCHKNVHCSLIYQFKVIPVQIPGGLSREDGKLIPEFT